MSLSDLVNYATDKNRFHSVKNYIDFCALYLEYVDTGLQARIVSQNESHYQFFQYREEGSFNITRPLNSLLMYDENDFAYALAQLTDDCDHGWIRNTTGLSHDECDKIMRIAYAAQKRVFK